MDSANRTFELLTQLVNSKKNLADTLVSKGEDASVQEPFDNLVEKAGNYIPKTYLLTDDEGNEIVGTLVEQEIVFDAETNDVREGKVFASETGVKTGNKVIPAYHTTEAFKVVTSGSRFFIKLANLDTYDYTKLQAIICEFNTSLADSVSATQIAIDNKVYEVLSTVAISEITKNDTDKTVEFGIENTTDKSFIIRYFTYKEIE